MNKVLVRVYVPTKEEQYDIWIPLGKKVYSITKLLVKAVNEFSEGYYNPKQIPSLYDKKTGNQYEVNAKIIETTIRNGTELILI